MEAKELRISNLILVNDVVQEVIELPLPENCTNDNTKGITLTEEWLLKFGGEKEIDNCWFFEDSWEWRTILYQDKKGFMFCFGNNNIRVEHVHQLQNLFYALSGEELTFND